MGAVWPPWRSWLRGVSARGTSHRFTQCQCKQKTWSGAVARPRAFLSLRRGIHISRLTTLSSSSSPLSHATLFMSTLSGKYFFYLMKRVKKNRHSLWVRKRLAPLRAALLNLSASQYHSQLIDFRDSWLNSPSAVFPFQIPYDVSSFTALTWFTFSSIARVLVINYSIILSSTKRMRFPGTFPTGFPSIADLFSSRFTVSLISNSRYFKPSFNFFLLPKVFEHISSQ